MHSCPTTQEAQHTITPREKVERVRYAGLQLLCKLGTTLRPARNLATVSLLQEWSTARHSMAWQTSIERICWGQNKQPACQPKMKQSGAQIQAHTSRKRAHFLLFAFVLSNTPLLSKVPLQVEIRGCACPKHMLNQTLALKTTHNHPSPAAAR